MVKNKGFTLVELLGVLGLVGVMLLIAIPSIIKLMENNEKNKNARFLKDLYNAAEVYVETNRELFPTLNVVGGKASVSVLTLIDNDYIKGNLIDPKTDKKINNDDAVIVDVNENKTFKYTFIRIGETEYTGPRIIIQDDDFEIMEGTTYNLLNGVIALGRSNEVLTVQVNIKDTSTLLIGEHEVVFSATDDEGNKSEVKKKLVVLKQFTYAVTYNYQTFTAPISGNYKIELWGGSAGGNGAYVSGEINLTKDTNLYLYVGPSGGGCNTYTDCGTSFNGGGAGGWWDAWNAKMRAMSGGGATDVRLVSGAWNDVVGLRSRIMVAGGAGTSSAGAVNGLPGANAPYGYPGGGGGSQIAGGSSSIAVGQFGVGGSGYIDSLTTCNCNDAWGGGGGYYGGGGGRAGSYSDCVHDNYGRSGGGSSYISGHKGSIAIKSETDQTPKVQVYSKIEDSYHYSGKIFTNTVMRSGNETMPTHDSKTTMVGNKGNGYAKITYIGK